ncbi:MAG: NUDIX domain-containing protein [Candidatus Daviesbacteria bacterium]|nr:NUDIX domain-containing protein [Candidatus Daviesbacteria bacterium]
MKIATLCYLIDSKKKRVLLGKKKYGGAKGKLNGFGGKVETKDITILECIKREFLEETGISLNNPKLSNVVFFNWEGEKENLVVYVYKCTNWSGDPKESEEMTADWYKLDSIPIGKMWASDSIWFPLAIKYSELIINLYFQPNKDQPKEVSIKFNEKLYENIHEKTN